jgi:malonate transporter
LGDVIGLALPFFGLIFIGFFCGKLLKYPEDGLKWMNFFIVYVALPALFFKLIAATPLQQLANWPFVTATTLSTSIILALSFGIGMLATRNIREATIQAVVGAYANIGYMGPGLTLAALGQGAIVPTALIFVAENILFFTFAPLMMALGGSGDMKLGQTVWFVAKRVVTHPFNIAVAVAIGAAAIQFEPPPALDTMLIFLKNAAAPCALFTMGVTVALRPLKRVPPEMPALLGMKLIVHPVLAWVLVSAFGDFGREWTMTAVLMASLPPALNVFVLATQYRVYVERASSAILVGTMVSVATVTTLLWLIGERIIPYRLPF